MDDDPDPALCSSCGSAERVGWSPLFGAWVCEPCRLDRTFKLLDVPVTAIPVKP